MKSARTTADTSFDHVLDALAGFQGLGYLAWTWNNWDCSQGPALVTDWVGDPTPYGAGYQAHLVSLAGG